MITSTGKMTIVALCALGFIAGCATSSKPAAPASQPLPSAVVGENVVSSTAVVKAINHETRQVTLQRPDGSLIKFKAGDEVRNLAQVDVGDEVTVTYYESLAYEVKKPGEAVPGAQVAEGLGRAKLGEKPGGVAGQVMTLTATIAAIDKGAGTVTLRSAEGELTTVKARHPEHLERVAVGDLVEITYTEALAISVEAPE